MQPGDGSGVAEETEIIMTARGLDATGAEAGWRGLYRVGGIAALIAAAIFRRNLGTEYILLRTMGAFAPGPTAAPTTAADWFALFRENVFLALTLFNLFDVVNYALVGLIYLALCSALRRVRPGAMALAAALGLTGVAVYLSSYRGFAMLALSARHAAATTDAARTTFVAAGEAVLAVSSPGSVYGDAGAYLSLFLVTVAGLIIAVAMRRSDLFGGVTAWMGILAHGLELGLFLALAAAPALSFIPPSLSALFLLAWYILSGLRLLRLARGVPERARAPRRRVAHRQLG